QKRLVRGIETCFFKRDHGDSRVPKRGDTRLNAKRILLLNFVALEKTDFSRHQRVPRVAALRKQRENRIHHGRINRAETVAAFQTFQHPLTSTREAGSSKRFPRKTVVELDKAIEPQEKILPGGDAAIPFQ